ncbi:MAG: tripartite tricarboxylate transporter substrate binding protein [Burkholderiaceae bacterium]
MKPPIFKNFYSCVASFILCIQSLSSAMAQNWPTGPIHMIVPFQAGGSTDFLARTLAQRFSERVQQTVIVENRPGANGTVGASYVAKSLGDGLNLLIVQAGFASNASLYKSNTFDPVKDLTPVSLLASGPLVLTVNVNLPVKNVKELIALAKAKSGEINFGSAGTGSLPHLAPELFNLMAGTKMTHIPYKGSGPALNDVIGGQVPVYYMNLVLSLPYLKAGKLKALAVTSLTRSPIAPEIPTLAESGLAGYDMSTWYGILVSSKTPKGIVNKISQDLAVVLHESAMTEKFYSDGVSVVAGTPEQFQEFLTHESLKFAKIIQSAGIKASD